MSKTPTYTRFKNRTDVKVSRTLLKMTKAELIDEILGTYTIMDLIELGFLERIE